LAVGSLRPPDLDPEPVTWLRLLLLCGTSTNAWSLACSWVSCSQQQPNANKCVANSCSLTFWYGTWHVRASRPCSGAVLPSKRQPYASDVWSFKDVDLHMQVCRQLY
jgi:hypothetical protein